MSLRPSVSSLSIAALREVMDVPDQWQRLQERLPEIFTSEDSSKLAGQFLAHGGFRSYLGNARQRPPERDFLAILVNALAQAQIKSSLDFDDPLFSNLLVKAQYDRLSEPFFRAFRNWFLNGRPMLGSHIDSNWCYYFYLRNAELPDFLAAISDTPVLSHVYQAESTIAWINEQREQQLDLWCFVN